LVSSAGGVSEEVYGVPKAVLSKRRVPGITCRVDGTLALSRRPAIEGRRSDIVCCAPGESAVMCVVAEVKLHQLRTIKVSQRLG
jgi:hypothetical protein